MQGQRRQQQQQHRLSRRQQRHSVYSHLRTNRSRFDLECEVDSLGDGLRGRRCDLAEDGGDGSHLSDLSESGSRRCHFTDSSLSVFCSCSKCTKGTSNAMRVCGREKGEIRGQRKEKNMTEKERSWTPLRLAKLVFDTMSKFTKKGNLFVNM